jgi:subtilisin family serine protease
VAARPASSSSAQAAPLDLLFKLPDSSPLASVIDSIFLDPPAGITGDTRASDTDGARKDNPNVIYLEEIFGLLGGGGVERRPTGKSVPVTVIDDDVDVAHGWFQKFTDFTQNNAAPAVRGLYHGTQACSCLLSVAPGVDLRFVRFIKKGAKSDYRTTFGNVARSDARIVNCSWGEFPVPAELEVSGKDAMSKWRFIWERETMVDYWFYACKRAGEKLLIWTAGNRWNGANDKIQGRPAQALLADLDNVIVVGGAMPARGGAPKFALDPGASPVAAAGALGGMRYTVDARIKLLDRDAPHYGDPDAPSKSEPPTAGQYTATTVCGLFPNGDPNGILMPDVNLNLVRMEYVDSWKLETGTSFAAPQVAGIAALILEIWSGAAPADVKRILTETSAPITGITNQPGNEDLVLWDQNRDSFVGLAHIERALALAQFCALVANVADPKTTAALNTVRIADAVVTFLRRNANQLQPVPNSGRPNLVLNNPPGAGLLSFDYKAALARFPLGP